VAGAGPSTMSAHRRSVMTAAAAGGLLCALWFVPTAKAAPDQSHSGPAPAARSAEHPAAPGPSDTPAQSGSNERASRLGHADSFGAAPGAGASDEVAYAVGGAGLTAAGGAFAVRTLRRTSGGASRSS
jgi:hypothetical protein